LKVKRVSIEWSLFSPKRLPDAGALPDFKIAENLYACAEKRTNRIVEEQV